jgi:hypothetical protein
MSLFFCIIRLHFNLTNLPAAELDTKRKIMLKILNFNSISTDFEEIYISKIETHKNW